MKSAPNDEHAASASINQAIKLELSPRQDAPIFE